MTPLRPPRTAAARPARLRPGARVAVVAPSGPVPADRLAAGLDVLRGWGLDAHATRHVLDGHPRLGHLAATDADRAADLQSAWCDPSVDAVLCARGGYGAQRIADLLDWTAIRAAGPKAFAGFSDVTALHEAFAVRAGFATLHAPMTATADFLALPPPGAPEHPTHPGAPDRTAAPDGTRARDHLRATLFAPETVRTLALGRPLVPGRAEGVTLGGCLSVLAAELGTPHARPSAAGGLLCLEDVGEEPYRLDRYLTQLLRSGWLDGVAGVLLGSWCDCGPYEAVRAVLLDRLGPLRVPVLEECGFGHAPGARTVALGARAVLDADAGTLTLADPALR
ncbi:LD-carboxypeptidase [Streptomyces sp. NPDC059578]|uniref:S66 peptidase family protein n=1 Tax=unclassified Streptomyces TaxID=2593676 RepID=UPI00364D6E7E